MTVLPMVGCFRSAPHSGHLHNRYQVGSLLTDPGTWPTVTVWCVGEAPEHRACRSLTPAEFGALLHLGAGPSPAKVGDFGLDTV